MPEQQKTPAPIEQEPQAKIPTVWLAVFGLVGAGIVIHVLLRIFVGGGLVIWPFIFSVCVLLIVNSASDEHAAGVTPFQAYALFFGTLLGFFVFVALVSTINPWVVILLTLAAGAYLVRDWMLRREKQRQIDRLRLAGLCVKCRAPVGDAPDELCPQCGMPVNPERLSLIQLGRAISNRARSVNARQVLTGTKPGRAAATAARLRQQSAYRYKRK